ncbi:DUF881 domain-containing protein [Dehalobacter sp. DCM]|uniref:DUF881 domain-containing protein n=1 Tax=Dehalobacter sp. DCM TaxID=2907827 RepID=UPI0030819B6B|nr:DUF881 domain-containing protein [Dehalobacter sp. DCM]
MLNKKVVTVVTIASIAIGILISLQFQTQREVDKVELDQQERAVLTQQVISNLQNENKQLKEEYAQLSAELEKYKKTGNDNPYIVAQLQMLKIADGTITVKGPGIRIVINDNTPEAIGFIRSADLLRIVNQLRLAGAEAISINGQRIVSTTSIVLSGDSTILINEVPVSEIGRTTYEILAIGYQENLVKYIDFVAKDLKVIGMDVAVTQEIVMIPSYKGDYAFEYAKEVKTE